MRLTPLLVASYEGVIPAMWELLKAGGPAQNFNLVSLSSIVLSISLFLSFLSVSLYLSSSLLCSSITLSFSFHFFPSL